MEKGQKEARIGLDAETEIVNKLNSDDKLRNDFIKCMSKIGFQVDNKFKAVKMGKNYKSDILICHSNCEVLGISLKTVKETKKGFHQVDRRWLDDWKNLLDMPDDIYNIFKDGVIRIAKNPRDKFILEKDQTKIKNFLKNKISIIIREIFVKNEKCLKILAIYDKRKCNKELYLINIDDFIEKFEKDVEIGFSKKGIIEFRLEGEKILTIQRKGGNGKGKNIGISKTDIRHTGNQLQFKMYPITLVDYIKNKKDEIRWCNITLN